MASYGITDIEPLGSASTKLAFAEFAQEDFLFNFLRKPRCTDSV
jgi:hypothetical protein